MKNTARKSEIQSSWLWYRLPLKWRRVIIVGGSLIVGALLWFHSRPLVLATFVGLLVLWYAVKPPQNKPSQLRKGLAAVVAFAVWVVLALGVLVGFQRHAEEAPARAVAAAQRAAQLAEEKRLLKYKQEIYKDLEEAGLNAGAFKLDVSPNVRYEGIDFVVLNNGEPTEARVRLSIEGFKELKFFHVKRGSDGYWRAGCFRPGGGWVAFDDPLSASDPRLLVERVRQEGMCPPSLPRN